MHAAEIKVKGIVQGVGFRPFIHLLVREHGLKVSRCRSAPC
ncbi:MAG: acylphosphatase [Oscillospiraceae bacterium]|nr:acylphosphatase [Oscillospiraceae bacterium]